MSYLHSYGRSAQALKYNMTRHFLFIQSAVGKFGLFPSFVVLAIFQNAVPCFVCLISQKRTLSEEFCQGLVCSILIGFFLLWPETERSWGRNDHWKMKQRKKCLERQIGFLLSLEGGRNSIVKCSGCPEHEEWSSCHVFTRRGSSSKARQGCCWWLFTTVPRVSQIFAIFLCSL